MLTPTPPHRYGSSLDGATCRRIRADRRCHSRRSHCRLRENEQRIATLSAPSIPKAKVPHASHRRPRADGSRKASSSISPSAFRPRICCQRTTSRPRHRRSHGCRLRPRACTARIGVVPTIPKRCSPSPISAWEIGDGFSSPIRSPTFICFVCFGASATDAAAATTSFRTSRRITSG